MGQFWHVGFRDTLVNDNLIYVGCIAIIIRSREGLWSVDAQLSPMCTPWPRDLSSMLGIEPMKCRPPWPYSRRARLVDRILDASRCCVHLLVSLAEQRQNHSPVDFHMLTWNFRLYIVLYLLPSRPNPVEYPTVPLVERSTLTVWFLSDHRA